MKRMNHQGMRCAFGVAAVIAAVGAQSCGSKEAAPPVSEQAELLSGSVRLPLVTPTRDQFRLRGASFELRRPGFELTLESDSNPDATALTAALDAGAYQITLRDGWSLERLDGDAGGPVPAALLTANPLSFEIQNGRVTELVYRFATEGGIVVFGSGELSISVDVVDSAPSASCSLVNAFGCDTGQTCLFGGEDGRTFCAVPGSLPVGAACSADQCVVGAQCLALDPAIPEARTCARFCDTSTTSFGCDCRALAFDDSVGVCIPRAPCAGPDCEVDVLVAAADTSFIEDVQNQLVGTGAFASVDVFQAAFSTPSLQELQNYDAVLVYANDSFADSNTLGQNLADYWDAGGRVVVATFANAGVPLGGRWSFDGYPLIQPFSSSGQFEFGPLRIFEPENPLLADVVSLTATSGFRSAGEIVNGGIVVASWGSGAPLIVRGERDGRARVELNFFPPSSQASSDFWVGSGAEIMRNALLFQ